MAVLHALEHTQDFTETERSLAQYILAHPSEVAHGNITELAQRTYTSNATIIRLCRKLGLEGFRELRIELAADLEKRRGAQEIVDVNYPIEAREDAASIMAKISALTKEAVDDCYAAITPASLEAVANLIHRAQTVYLFATGDSQVSAEAFENMLVKIGIHCVVAERYGEQISVANSASAGDLALFISYRGIYLNNAEQKDIPRILKERGCATALISATEKPFWIEHQISLPTREDKDGKRMATFYSQACIRYILNCLYSAVFSLDFASNKKHLD